MQKPNSLCFEAYKTEIVFLYRSYMTGFNLLNMHMTSDLY